MKMLENDDFKFNKSLRGYDPTEVNSFLGEFIEKYNALLIKNKNLKEEIEEYKKKQEIIQLTLVTAQETAEKIKLAGENEANKSKINAEKQAYVLIEEAENEVKAYRDSIHTYFYNCERQLSLVLEDFYTLSRKHISSLEHEFMQRIKSKLQVFDRKLDEFSISEELKNKIENIDDSEINDKWQRNEYSLILGQMINCDIIDSNKEVLFEKGTTVTPELIELSIKKGLYGELISSIDNSKEDSVGA